MDQLAHEAYAVTAYSFLTADPSLIAFGSEPMQNIWKWTEFGGLASDHVSTRVYFDVMSMMLSRRALELGFNFFDTANVYSDGTSEEIVGRALKDFARREEVVIATKVNGRMHKGPNGAGLSRKAIMTEVDASLRRLGTDYIDLYQIHRWDYATPIEETLEALHDVVKAGKARYIGASSMYAWQFAKALAISERHGWTRFVTMQNYLNLLYREEDLGREHRVLAADDDRVAEVGHALDEPDQEGVGQTRLHQRQGHRPKGLPAARAQGLRRLLQRRADALHHAAQDQEGDRGERE